MTKFFKFLNISQYTFIYKKNWPGHVAGNHRFTPSLNNCSNLGIESSKDHLVANYFQISPP